MKFLDTNILIYDYLQLERKLDERTLEIKKHSHEIMERIKDGEEKVVTTVVHISEVSNILYNLLAIELSYEVISGLLSSDFIIVEDIDKNKYIEGLELARQNRIKINDGLAVVVMKNLGITEIYSFDEHFDKIEGIQRIER